jgi:hypothetical protein
VDLIRLGRDQHEYEWETVTSLALGDPGAAQPTVIAG